MFFFSRSNCFENNTMCILKINSKGLKKSWNWICLERRIAGGNLKAGRKMPGNSWLKWSLKDSFPVQGKFVIFNFFLIYWYYNQNYYYGFFYNKILMFFLFIGNCFGNNTMCECSNGMYNYHLKINSKGLE